jgi:hypothetical protein
MRREAMRPPSADSGMWGNMQVGMFAAEAMHTIGPLQADDPALDGGEQRQRKNEGERNGYREVDPRFYCCPRQLVVHDSNDEDVPDNRNADIGWQIVCAMAAKVETTVRAAVGNLEIAPVKRADAAAWTATAHPICDGLPQVARHNDCPFFSFRTAEG